MKKAFKKIISAIIPKRKIIIFESNPDFSDNTYWLFKYIAENDLFEDYKFVWSIADESKARKELCGAKISCLSENCDNLLKKVRQILYLNSAQIIIDCNRVIHKKNKKQIRIHLGHGMPIKTVDFYMRTVGECDRYVILGERFRSFYAKYGYKKTAYSCGFPRNEVLINSTPSDEKFIIWMPTYRQHNNGKNVIDNEFPLGIPAIKNKEELLQIQEYLEKNNIKLFLRPHPAQDLSFFKVSEMNNIEIANDDYLKSQGITLYEFIAKSSALITDYSSVYYDYLLTQRPIGLTLEDHESYSKKYGMYFDDIRNDMKGHLIDTASDMIDFIESVAKGEDRYFKDRENFRKEFGIEPFESSKMIVEYLQNQLKKTR